jgi:predicted unusual protein kinase regulating ubiquinone biosynthesis (AarF/ABC1/UbiB family)
MTIACSSACSSAEYLSDPIAFAMQLSTFESLSWMGLDDALRTFAYSMRQQLDLLAEAHNLVEFRQNFKGISNVAFPEPILNLCYSKYVAHNNMNNN